MRTRIGVACGLIVIGLTTVVGAAPPTETVQDIVCRGTSGEGFSYEWGGECWCGNGCDPDLVSCNPGTCTPNAGSTGCPDCTHTGTYGADCSGFVSKAWQVPNPNPVEACDVDRYVASSFTKDHEYWDVVPMSDLRPADATASSTHVILVIGAKDPYGEHEVVEAKGCNYGIVRQSRTFSSSYSGARRINITQCVCADGDEESRACGDCGTESRTCEGGCTWSAWSACEGPDPSGTESACTVDGAAGACADGQRRCVAGWLTCQAAAATAEVCDGVDNDCDGVVDNGTPESLGEGEACTNACGEGQTVCIDGALRCVTPGTTWPDETCEGGASGAAGSAGSPGGRSWYAADPASGCACGVTRSDGPPGALAMVLGLLVWGLRRKRREEAVS